MKSFLKTPSAFEITNNISLARRPKKEEDDNLNKYFPLQKHFFGQARQFQLLSLLCVQKGAILCKHPDKYALILLKVNVFAYMLKERKMMLIWTKYAGHIQS